MPTLINPSTQRKYFNQHLKDTGIQGPGRPRGSRNKIPGHVRHGIVAVFERLGGVEGLLAWAMDNPDSYYGSVLPKVLPAELAESGAGTPIRVLVYAPQANTPAAPIELTSAGPPSEAISENP